MAKTIEHKSAEFVTLMATNGFTDSGAKTYDGRTVYSRRWTKEVEVLWRGKCGKSLEIKIDEALGMPIINIYKDGRRDECCGYSTPKRAINAMREIVTFAGFEF